MKPELRRRLLFAGLAVTLAATAWTRWREANANDVAQIAEPAKVVTVKAAAETTEKPSAAPRVTPEAKAVELPLARLERRANAETTPSDIDPFRAMSWYVAPPAPPPPPPPKPTAPALPFQYMGKKEAADGSGKVAVYLAKGNDVFTVSPGDVFDTNYQFEKIDKGTLVIVFLPLATKQRLPLGTFE